MSSSQPAQSNTPSPSEVILAMREASTALVVASAEDLDAVAAALDRLEQPGGVLARSESVNGAHPAVRAEIDKTGAVTRRLLEEMLDERDKVRCELMRLDPDALADDQVVGAHLDLSS